MGKRVSSSVQGYEEVARVSTSDRERDETQLSVASEGVPCRPRIEVDTRSKEATKALAVNSEKTPSYGASLESARSRVADRVAGC